MTNMSLLRHAYRLLPEKAEASAKEIGLDLDRSYPDYKTMALEESKREDGIDVVSIVTPKSYACRTCN
jgi:predicted dehydrogenase